MDGQTREGEASGRSRINPRDIDGQAEGRVSGSERVKLHHNGAIDFIDRLGQWLAPAIG